MMALGSSTMVLFDRCHLLVTRDCLVHNPIMGRLINSRSLTRPPICLFVHVTSYFNQSCLACCMLQDGLLRGTDEALLGRDEQRRGLSPLAKHSNRRGFVGRKIEEVQDWIIFITMEKVLQWIYCTPLWRTRKETPVIENYWPALD